MTPFISKEKIITCETAQQRFWDVVIIGGGMGGGSAAHALSVNGHSVLVIEKGFANFENTEEGIEVEQEDPNERLKNGRWPYKLSGQVDGAPFEFWAPLGCGLGGSSLQYGAALQRLRPKDFEPITTPEGNSISWPISYEDIEPYYQKAETLFSVCGTEDPLDKESTYDLAPPPQMCEADEHLFNSFRDSGFNPYRLHVAMKYKNGCGECGGHICEHACKSDSRNSCISPGMQNGNLFVVERGEVIQLNASPTSVSDITVRQNGKDYSLRGRIIVLAAGAYFTPSLLLKSQNEYWPRGLANSSDLVGKNLMFHAGDFIAIWPKQKYSRVGPKKTIALRDLYNVNGTKLGEFQSTGLSADYGYVLYALRQLFDQSPIKKLTPLRQLLRIPAYLASKFYGEAAVFATIIEDFPYEENCVLPDDSTPSGIRFRYTIRKELTSRVMQLRERIHKNLSSLRSISMNMGVTLNYGHPCGTCKAGTDPKTSVVDKYCKAHDIDNLYIADSSFMPTSGGTNPGLTIAANALRVADAIHNKLATTG